MNPNAKGVDGGKENGFLGNRAIKICNDVRKPSTERLPGAPAPRMSSTTLATRSIRISGSGLSEA
jgi:hypothetical protein